MKQWFTISTAVAAGIVLAVLVLVVLGIAFGNFMMNMPMMHQGMNGMSDTGMMHNMMQYMMDHSGH